MATILLSGFSALGGVLRDSAFFTVVYRKSPWYNGKGRTAGKEDLWQERLGSDIRTLKISEEKGSFTLIRRALSGNGGVGMTA